MAHLAGGAEVVELDEIDGEQEGRDEGCGVASGGDDESNLDEEVAECWFC